ncbi:MAG: hypothetical protein RR405_00145 [Clostridia bacterium]
MKRSFKITNEQIEELRPYMENIDELADGGLEDFMHELNNVVIYYFKDDEPTKLAYKLERIYDEIRYAN